MITNESIDQLRDKLDIVEVIEKEVTLKKRGAVYVGCCPFHDEATPSFTVSPIKQIFKCFGCGTGGDSISFVMKKENIEFIPAIRVLASRYNHQLEEVEETAEEKEASAKKADLWKINEIAAGLFQEELLEMPRDQWAAAELLERRKFTPDIILEFGLGFAPDQWRFLTDTLTNKGLFYPAEDLGLVKSNDAGQTFDIFRNRLIFPIHNEQGQIVGFGGRKPSDDTDKSNPKYINSKESLLYKKERTLYGLYQAKKHIKAMGFAIAVEGYTDVISMHQSGAGNTVGACGTSLTTFHAKLLKRYTKHVVLLSDGDIAGQNSNFKSVDILLKEGLQVDICPLPEKHDPDSFAREHFAIADPKLT